jgi:hypothetical protein
MHGPMCDLHSKTRLENVKKSEAERTDEWVLAGWFHHVSVIRRAFEF